MGGVEVGGVEVDGVEVGGVEDLSVLRFAEGIPGFAGRAPVHPAPTSPTTGRSSCCLRRGPRAVAGRRLALAVLPRLRARAAGRRRRRAGARGPEPTRSCSARSSPRRTPSSWWSTSGLPSSPTPAPSRPGRSSSTSELPLRAHRACQEPDRRAGPVPTARRVHRHRQQIAVTMLEVRGDQVRVGIDAPRDVQVHREEVWQPARERERPGGEQLRPCQAVGRAHAGPAATTARLTEPGWASGQTPEKALAASSRVRASCDVVTPRRSHGLGRRTHVASTRADPRSPR